MKFCLLAVFIFMSINCSAYVPDSIIKHYRHIISLIQNDKAEDLASLIVYPLKRLAPLPDIHNKKEFVDYYPILFDSFCKDKFNSFHDSVITSFHPEYSLIGGEFHGDMWINQQGKIMGLSCSSRTEMKKRDSITKYIQSRTHPSVNSWESNLITGKTKNLYVRVDLTTEEIRYASWSNGKPTSEKPDIVLHNGEMDMQGTAGGWIYTFKNDDWTYIVDDRQMCETEDKCGIFLTLLFKGEEKSKMRLTEVKY